MSYGYFSLDTIGDSEKKMPEPPGIDVGQDTYWIKSWRTAVLQPESCGICTPAVLLRIRHTWCAMDFSVCS